MKRIDRTKREDPNSMIFESFRKAFEEVGLEAAAKAWQEGRVDMPELFN